MEEIAWYANAPKLGARRPWGVAKKKPNAWGLYDMHGNAAEVTSDVYRELFSPSPVRDPQVARSECDDGKINSNGTIGCYRAIRGGSFLSRAGYCRSASRSDDPRIGIQHLESTKYLKSELIGLRLVRTKTKL